MKRAWENRAKKRGTKLGKLGRFNCVQSLALFTDTIWCQRLPETCRCPEPPPLFRFRSAIYVTRQRGAAALLSSSIQFSTGIWICGSFLVAASPRSLAQLSSCLAPASDHRLSKALFDNQRAESRETMKRQDAQLGLPLPHSVCDRNHFDVISLLIIESRESCIVISLPRHSPVLWRNRLTMIIQSPFGVIHSLRNAMIRRSIPPSPK